MSGLADVGKKIVGSGDSLAERLQNGTRLAEILAEVIKVFIGMQQHAAIEGVAAHGRGEGGGAVAEAELENQSSAF